MFNPFDSSCVVRPTPREIMDKAGGDANRREFDHGWARITRTINTGSRLFRRNRPAFRTPIRRGAGLQSQVECRPRALRSSYRVGRRIGSSYTARVTTVLNGPRRAGIGHGRRGPVSRTLTCHTECDTLRMPGWEASVANFQERLVLPICASGKNNGRYVEGRGSPSRNGPH
jgi:hypothetical protein